MAKITSFIFALCVFELIAVGTSEDTWTDEDTALKEKYAAILKKPPGERIAAMDQLCNEEVNKCSAQSVGELQEGTLNGDVVKKIIPAIQQFGCKTPACAKQYVEAPEAGASIAQTNVIIKKQICELMARTVKEENMNTCTVE